MEGEITITNPVDAHVHFRQSPQLEYIAPLTAKTFAAALIMPNTIPSIEDTKMLDSYRADVEFAVRDYKNFRPLYTLFFNTKLANAKTFGHATAVKLYPDGVTTNSSGGMEDAAYDHPDVLAVLERMQDQKIPLCVHGETEGFIMDREKEFLDRYKFWSEKFPELQIVMEHITTKEAVELAQEKPNLHATITAHHLLITLDDVLANGIKPHNYCKPIAKRPDDREALVKAALSGNDKFMLGTDSAPHHRVFKETSCGCAGVFTAPIALQMVAEVFQKNDGTVTNMQKFVSDNARNFYNLDFCFAKEVTLTNKVFFVPTEYHGVVPFRAGQRLWWSVTSVS